MIQVREQYGNLYVRILDTMETFEYTLEKIRTLPERSFKSNTGEWMFPKERIGDILRSFDNQIVWMQPLEKIVEGMQIEDSLVQQHLHWQNNDDFKTWHLKPFPYQKTGCHFLADRGAAAIFDGVGLGKTPQVIGACQILMSQGKAKKVLIVTLSSLKRQWAKEVEKFTPMKALPIVGTASRREKMIREFGKRNDLQFMMINYEMLRSSKLLKLILDIGFDIVALDEGHKIRTGVTDPLLKLKPSGIAEGAYALKSIPHRFIATATPVQGKPQEIWSLFHFIDENILGSWELFRERYTTYNPRWGISGAQNEGELYMRIAPHFIRRTKEMKEIQQQLPKVKHDHIFLEMQDVQEKLQTTILDKIQEVKDDMRSRFLTDEEQEKMDGILQGLRTFLLENCDSPGLFLESDSGMIKGLISDAGVSYDKLKVSPKADYVKDFIEQVMYDEPSSKFVVFTRYETMARLLADMIPNSVLYTGKVSERMKDYAKESFITNPNTKVFIATDAGSTGLNLQVANYMIHVDLPDSPTDIEQRNGRIDRTGNAFPNIVVQYLVMSDGYDEHMLELMDKKAGMANAILEGGKMKKDSVDYNKLALERMLKNKTKTPKRASAAT